MASIKENLSYITSEIQAICDKIGRKSESVKLLAVSKKHSTSEMQEAYNAGQLSFGENHVQEAYTKVAELATLCPKMQLHIIGHLQRNKVKKAVEIASCIQSVDSLQVLQEIEKHCATFDKKINVFFELHTAEDTKTGFAIDGNDLCRTLEQCSTMTHIVPCGLMTIAPNTDCESDIRNAFRVLYKMRERLHSEFPEYNIAELSMGMSQDFRIAIQEGATMVRIGTAIFGQRNYDKA